MEIVQSLRKPSVTADVVSFLPLYRDPPHLEVRLEDFELFAIDRLRVLRGISDGLSRGKKPDEMEKLVEDLWKTHMRHPHASEVIEKDIISHFVLRLVYCRTEDLRKWFLSMETMLFRYRFKRQSFEAQRTNMKRPLNIQSVVESLCRTVKARVIASHDPWHRSYIQTFSLFHHSK